MSQTTTTDETVNYEIWVAERRDIKRVKVYPDLPDYCWAVARRLRGRYEAAGVIRSIRLERVTRHNAPCPEGGVRRQVKERRTLMFSCGLIYKDINS